MWKTSDIQLNGGEKIKPHKHDPICLKTLKNLKDDYLSKYLLVFILYSTTEFKFPPSLAHKKTKGGGGCTF